MVFESHLTLGTGYNIEIIQFNIENKTEQSRADAKFVDTLCSCSVFRDALFYFLMLLLCFLINKDFNLYACYYYYENNSRGSTNTSVCLNCFLLKQMEMAIFFTLLLYDNKYSNY